MLPKHLTLNIERRLETTIDKDTMETPWLRNQSATAWSDFHAGSRFARFTIPEEKRGLLEVTARSFLYFSGGKKIRRLDEYWYETQSLSIPVFSNSHSRKSRKRPTSSSLFKKKVSLHLGSRALAFDASYGTCCQFWIKSRSSESPYK